MSSFDLWTISPDVKFSRLSPSFVKFFNTNHIPLVSFEALLPYLIDNANLLGYNDSGEAINFNLSAKDIKCIEDFLVGKGYLTVLDSSQLTNSELKFKRTDKVISIEDVAIFGSLCFQLLKKVSKRTTKYPAVLDLFKSGKFFDTNKNKYREFMSLGRQLNAIKSNEYSKIITELSNDVDTLDSNGEPFKLYKDNNKLLKLADSDKKILASLISSIANVIPDIVTPDVVYDFNAIVDDGYGFNVYSKILEISNSIKDADTMKKVDSDIQKIMDIALKSTDSYIFFSIQHAMDYDIYKSFEKDKSNSNLSNKSSNDFITIQGKLLNSNVIVVDYISKLNDLKKLIRKYKSDLVSIKKAEVKLPEEQELMGNTSEALNITGDNEYYNNLSKKHEYETEYKNTDVNFDSKNIHNYIVKEINDNIYKLKQDVITGLTEDLDKSISIYDKAKSYMESLSQVLNEFSKTRSTIEYRLESGLQVLLDNYVEFLKINNKSTSDVTFEDFENYLSTVREKSDKSGDILNSIFDSFNYEVYIILDKCKNQAQEVESIIKDFNSKYRDVSDNAIDLKNFSSNNNVDVLLAGLKYLKSVGIKNTLGDKDYLQNLDIQSVLDNGYSESDKAGLIKAFKNMAEKMDAIRIDVINSAKEKFNLRNEEIYKFLEDLFYKKFNPKVVNIDSLTDKDLKYDKNLNINNIVKKYNLRKKQDIVDVTTNKLSKEQFDKLLEEYNKSDYDNKDNLLNSNPELKEYINEQNYSRRLQLGDTYDSLKDLIKSGNNLNDADRKNLLDFITTDVDPYLSSKYLNNKGLDKLQENLKKLELKYNKYASIKSSSKLNNFYKIINAAADFTVTEFDQIFQQFDESKIQNSLNPLANYYISYMTTICKQLQDYFMLKNKAVSEEDIQKVISNFINKAKNNQKLINTLPFETTLDFLVAKEKEIVEQIVYITLNDFEANLKSEGILKTLSKEIITFNKDLNLTFENNNIKDNPYVISGSYSPEDFIKYLQSLNVIDPNIVQDIVNKCTLFVSENLYYKYIDFIGTKFNFDKSLYYKSIVSMRDDLIYEVLNNFKAVVITDEKLGLSNTDGFSQDILLPAFKKYMSSIPADELRTPDKCFNSVKYSKKYNKESLMSQYQYANFYVVNYIKSLILDFYKSLPQLQYLFSLDSGNITFKTKKKEVNETFACEAIFFEALKLLGLYTPEGLIETNDTYKLMYLYNNFSKNPNSNRYGGHAKITSTGPFVAWRKILETMSTSYRKTTLYYIKSVLDDVGCNKKYLEKVDRYVLSNLVMDDSEKQNLVNLMNNIQNNFDSFENTESIIQTDLKNIENFAINIINNDSILSKYVYFDLNSFNLDLCKFDFKIDYRKIHENNSFDNSEEINDIQFTMKNIVKALKSMSSYKVADILNVADTFYKKTLSVTANKGVTASMVEERLLQFNKALKNYVAQLHQEFNKFKTICKSMIDSIDAYTASFIEVLNKEENAQQKEKLEII